jgi:hypothetical protein
VSFALFVEPLKLEAAAGGKPGAGESAPVVLAVGRTPAKDGAAASLWVRVDLANADVQELVSRMGKR